MRLTRCQSLARRWPAHSRRPNCSHHRLLTTLAIETSCDDTAVAILHKDDASGRHSLLFNERVTSDHREFRGIEPNVAVKGHTSALAPLLSRAITHLPRPRTRPDEAPGQAPDQGRIEQERTCLAADGLPRELPDFVTATRGPGIMTNLSVGLNTAKGLAVAWGVPLVGAHHMQAHALTPRLVRALGMPMPVDDDNNNDDGASSTSGPDFPFLSLLVSGGHTQLVHSRSLADHRIVATTADVAIGNLLDHSARDVLPPELVETSEDVMYGRVLEAFAFPEGGTPQEHAAAYTPASTRAEEIEDPETGYDWVLPVPFRLTRRLAYTFTGIGTSIQRLAKARPDMGVDERRALAKHTMATAFAHLASRLCIALEDDPSLRPRQGEGEGKSEGVSTLVVAGGVACNRFLQHVLRSTLAARGHGHIKIVVAPPALCTDNAAMIAWTGMEMYEAGFHTDPSALAISKWPMDPEHGPGILGVSGWLRRPGFEEES